MTVGRSGANTTVCDECGGVLEYDYLDELWRHVEGNKPECENTGRND
jgi:hypothetical protein